MIYISIFALIHLHVNCKHKKTGLRSTRFKSKSPQFTYTGLTASMFTDSWHRRLKKKKQTVLRISCSCAVYTSDIRRRVLHTQEQSCSAWNETETDLYLWTQLASSSPADPLHLDMAPPTQRCDTPSLSSIPPAPIKLDKTLFSS